MQIPGAVRTLSVRDYHRMAEAGIFSLDERVELLEGRLFSMAAKGTAHSSATTRTRQALERGLGDRVLIRVQDPVQLDDYSEPEPDLAIVALDPLEYGTHHPKPSEIYLLIEIADSSLEFDCGAKVVAYAKAKIADYWVLDVQSRRLYVFRTPQNQAYQSQLILMEGMQIEPLAFPDCKVTVRDLLPLLAS